VLPGGIFEVNNQAVSGGASGLGGRLQEIYNGRPDKVIFVKGAPDVVLRLCTHEQTADGPAPLDDERRRAILAVNDGLARRALRTLGIASRRTPAGVVDIQTPGPALERDLVFDGLVGLIDPPRDEAREAEARARQAGMDAFLGKPVRLATLAAVITQQVRAPQAAGEDPERIADSGLRQKLVAQFAAETPALLTELRTALAAGDWTRLRRRAHYLKNSADVLGLRGLQDACARLAGLDEPPDAAAAQRLLDEIEAAIPGHLIASSDFTPAAKI